MKDNKKTMIENYNKKEIIEQKGLNRGLFDPYCRKEVKLGCIIPNEDMFFTDQVFNNVDFIMTGPEGIVIIYVPTPNHTLKELDLITQLLLKKEKVPFFEVDTFNGTEHIDNFCLTLEITNVTIIPSGMLISIKS